MNTCFTVTAIEAMTKLHAALADFPKQADLVLPDTSSAATCLVYDTRVQVDWEPKLQRYLIGLYAGTELVRLGAYNLADTLTVLKSSTL